MHTLTSFFKKTHVAVIGIFFALLILAGGLAFSRVSAQTSGGNVTGDIWSSTIGRISMNCANGGASGQNVCATSTYGVNVTPNTSTQTGDFSGYAWSPYIGWVSFESADTVVCGGGAELNMSNNRIYGWARALVGSNASGWDGCISLYGLVAGGGTYGVVYNPALTTNNLSGFAWGGVNAGWIGFTGATLTLGASNIDLKANGSDTLSLPPYGGSVVLSWVGTSIASTSCTASGDWSGSKTPSAGGSDPAITIPANTTTNPVTYTYTISCIGTNAATVTDTATVTVPAGGGSNPPYLAFKANGVPAGGSGSPGSVSVFPGDTVNFEWNTTNIQPNSCVGQITGAVDANWTTGYLASSDTTSTTGPHTYSIASITAVPVTRTYTMHGCLDFTNTAVADQAITITILPPPTCKVVSSVGTPSAVITVPSTGVTGATKKFGAVWENTKGFFSITLGVPAGGGAGGPTVSIANPIISSKTSSATVTVSSSGLTAPMSIPLTITGTPSTGAPASSCTPGTLYLVSQGMCNDPCAIPATIGTPNCGYNAQFPRGCATKRAPWEEF